MGRNMYWKPVISSVHPGNIDHVLEPVLLPYLEEVQDGIFQQDNARPYIVHVSMNFLADNNVNILPCMGIATSN